MRLIVDLVIENPGSTGREIATMLYARDVDPQSGEMKRVRVALNTLCKQAWLRCRVKNGLNRYRFNRRHPPKKDDDVRLGPDPSSSTYAARTLEYLVREAEHGRWQVSVEGLRAMLRMPANYRFHKIRPCAIDPAVEKFNLQTNVMVSWQPIKDGNVVRALDFRFARR
ncbi:replication initiation protein [Burkholderia sp. JKS000303]|uniref:replication initiation protein n=1 Tax=Burkholderia sp. JKS000303 TaxID=1938747 RepID=UPI000BF55E3E|nr:replication initiation protein [Burkholderia sp. JKS000303]